MYSPRFTALWILLAASGLSFGCAGQTDGSDSDASEESEELIIRGGFNPRPPTVIGWAPDPTFPQKNLYVIGRTVTPRVLATPTTPAVPGAATFRLGWESTGSPTQVFVYRQVMILGATNTAEYTLGPSTQIAALGALPNGYQTFTDPAPALNVRNCYFIKAGDGTYFSYSGWACAEAPNPNNPHKIGKVQIRLRLSTASSAPTEGGNVKVRLHYGIPGTAGSAYTWLDAVDTPFYTPGAEQIFTLNTPGIRDLSDITMIRVEVPGDNGLCLNQLELIVDDTRAFLKTSPGTQECGNGNPFEWAWHSGLIEGTMVEIPFQELRNNSTWQNFNPPPFPGTVTSERPEGSTFVGYTVDELRRKLDGMMAHNLKDDGSFTGSSRRFRNGNSDRTSITRINENTVRVQQHVRLDDGTCTVDAHPVFNLNINSYNALNELYNGWNGPIERTEITTQLLSEGIDQGGPCQWIPGIGALIQFSATSQFGSEFNAVGPTDAGKPPFNTRFCFPGPGLARPFLDFDNGGLSLCFL